MDVKAAFVILNFMFIRSTDTVSHESTLLWTEKADNSLVRIVGVPGEPSEWLKSGEISLIGQGMPASFEARIISSRIALAFRYSSKNMFFSDRGFKEIMRTKLQIQQSSTYTYNVTINRVYSGASKEVNGLAVDWVSGSLYWTDALYNWITVCNSQRFDVYRHLVTTKLDRPVGLAVHPQKGFLYWSDWGDVPKIERSSLLGSNRKTLVSSNIHRPLGMSLDYKYNTLYWVDEWSDSIESVDIDGGHRHSIVLESSAYNSHVQPWGIAIYNHTAFVTDQHHRSIHIISLSTEKRIARLELRNMPYDVMMYHESIQKEHPSQCDDLQCDHICVSEGQIENTDKIGASCLCKQGFLLDQNGKTCIEDPSLQQPLWIYSVGHSLCTARINVPDTLDSDNLSLESNCFRTDVKQATALAHHSYANFLFYSDTSDKTITRLRVYDGLENDMDEPIYANVPSVKGITVDWISDNLYWSDEDLGIMVISRLDGRYPHILKEGMGQPRGIDINPLEYVLFWTDPSSGSVMTSQLDGANKKVFIDQQDSPDGVSVDVKDKRVFWVDTEGVKSRHTDGSDQKNLFLADDDKYSFRSIASYQDYYAWSNGIDTLYFGNKQTGQLHTGAKHLNALVSHDIIAYSTYLQPEEQGACDEENGGCEHLCFAISKTESRCKCAVGFDLDSDQKSCVSALTNRRFLLMTDPFHKQIYQLDLTSSKAEPQGLYLPNTLHYPEFFDMDPETNIVYYVNSLEKVIKMTNLTNRRDDVIVEHAPDTSYESLWFSRSTKEVIYVRNGPSETGVYATHVTKKKTRLLTNVERGFSTAMVFDDRSGKVYWAETYNEQSHIFMQDMSDKNSKSIIWESNFIVQGLTIDKYANKLLWCTYYHIWSSNMEGNNKKELYSDTSALLVSIAATPSGIYASHQDKRHLVRIHDRESKDVTEEMFARITDIKEFYSLESFKGVARPITGESIQEQSSGVNLVVLVAIVGTVVMILILVLIIAVVLWVFKKKPRVSREDYDTQAHDNPTYATHNTVIPRRTEEEDPYDTLPGAEGDIPDIVKMKSGLGDDGSRPDPYGDKHNLVVPAEVVLNVDDVKGYGVQYKK